MVRIQTLSIAIASAACVAIGSALTASSAQAAIITNNFRVDVTSGPLIDQAFFGSFTYDDTALSDPNILTDPDVDLPIITPSNGLLNITFNFLGKTYNQTNDADYLSDPNNPPYPRLYFDNGSLLVMEFFVSEDPSFSNPTDIPSEIYQFNFSYDPNLGGAFFRSRTRAASELDQSGMSLGTVTYGIQAVPTPTLLPGLIGLGIGVLRKRQAEAKEQVAES